MKQRASLQRGANTFIKAKKAKDTSEMETLCEDLKSACTAFAKKMGYSGLSWTVTYKNEIEVDPR